MVDTTTRSPQISGQSGYLPARTPSDSVNASVLSLPEAKRELDRLLEEITLPYALRFVRHIERLPLEKQTFVCEMSVPDLVVYFAHRLGVVNGKLVTRHMRLFHALNVPQYKQVIDLVEYGVRKYPQRFWHAGQPY